MEGEKMTHMFLGCDMDELNIEYWESDEEQCSDISWVAKLNSIKLNMLSRFLFRKEFDVLKG